MEQIQHSGFMSWVFFLYEWTVNNTERQLKEISLCVIINYTYSEICFKQKTDEVEVC